MRDAFFRWAPLVAYTALILVLSLTPEPEGMPQIPYADKAAHFVAYAVLGLFWARALRAGKARGARDWAPIAVTFFFGVFVEGCQYFVPERSAEVADAIANGIGGFAGAYLYRFLSMLFNARRYSA